VSGLGCGKTEGTFMHQVLRIEDRRQTQESAHAFGDSGVLVQAEIERLGGQMEQSRGF